MADDTSAPNSSSGSNGSLNGGADFPEGFPHASRLKQAGVTSLADLRDVESLEDLSGIGPAYAQDIQNALEGAGTGAPTTGGANGTSTGAATTEKRPSPLSEGDAESSAGGAATRQTIDIPEGPLEETVTYETYPADTYGHDELGIADDEVLDLLRNMLLQRRFENRCRQMYQRQKISGFLHLYIGQEAVSTGSVNAIELGDDSVITAYRDHGMGLAMGITPEEGMAELFGKETGCSKGKGGSMHFFDAEKKMMGGHAIVGAHLPLGAGLAFAHKYRGEDNVCLCFFGDGAMHQGAFREACNLAGIYELPIVFVCENNQYAMGTAVDRATSSSTATTSTSPRPWPAAWTCSASTRRSRTTWRTTPATISRRSWRCARIATRATPSPTRPSTGGKASSISARAKMPSTASRTTSSTGAWPPRPTWRRSTRR
jgi:pyruvate dehydrogenase E1 component alpha subunit